METEITVVAEVEMAAESVVVSNSENMTTFEVPVVSVTSAFTPDVDDIIMGSQVEEDFESTATLKQDQEEA